MLNTLFTTCALIDPTVDWSAHDLSHLSDIKITLNPASRHIVPKLIDSNYWPEAVKPSLITAKSQRLERANTILKDFVRQDLSGKKFLDIGCDSGECVQAAQAMGAIARGYDLKEQWENHHDWYTTDWQKVVTDGPYDVILMYDVLDHVFDETLLFNLQQLAKPGTRFYVRCHPYCARHGTHLYETFNKAYAHLFLTPEELSNRGAIGTPTQQVWVPTQIYESIYRRSRLKILANTVVSFPVEPIIETCLPFIVQNWKQYSLTPKEILQILSIQFLDYVLEINFSEQ